MSYQRTFFRLHFPFSVYDFWTQSKLCEWWCFVFRFQVSNDTRCMKTYFEAHETGKLETKLWPFYSFVFFKMNNKFFVWVYFKFHSINYYYSLPSTTKRWICILIQFFYLHSTPSFITCHSPFTYAERFKFNAYNYFLIFHPEILIITCQYIEYHGKYSLKC